MSVPVSNTGPLGTPCTHAPRVRDPRHDCLQSVRFLSKRWSRRSLVDRQCNYTVCFSPSRIQSCDTKQAHIMLRRRAALIRGRCVARRFLTTSESVLHRSAGGKVSKVHVHASQRWSPTNRTATLRISVGTHDLASEAPSLVDSLPNPVGIRDSREYTCSVN